MKYIAMLCLIPLVTTGCLSSRALYDASAAAAAGGAGYALSGGNLLYTIGGAAAGVVASEMLQASSAKGRVESYNKGYDRGKADAVKNQYWIMQQAKAQKTKSSIPEPRYGSYTFPVQGANEVPHNITVRIAE